ncbi:MAG: hypothetical protein MK081_15535 [Flavobacteriales bacterium]|nr:hypothetical protein [Flavobacteriales bacterium]
MKWYFRTIMLLILISCSENEEVEFMTSPSSKPRSEVSNRYHCIELRLSLSSAFEAKNYQDVVSLNQELNLNCNPDTLAFLTTQLEISKVYYDDADSVLYYLRRIWNRPDRNEVWSDSELLLSFAITFDVIAQRDSACIYFELLREEGDLEQYNRYFPQRLDYCD